MVTQTSDLTGAGEIVEALGEAWTFAHVGPQIKGTFSAWLKARARQGLLDERKAGTLDPATYREEADALKRQFDAGAYDWGSPLDPESTGSAIAVAIDEPPGRVRLLQLLLEPEHGDVPPAKVREILKDNQETVNEALRSCLDPNRPRPAKKPDKSQTAADTPEAA